MDDLVPFYKQKLRNIYFYLVICTVCISIYPSFNLSKYTQNSVKEFWFRNKNKVIVSIVGLMALYAWRIYHAPKRINSINDQNTDKTIAIQFVGTNDGQSDQTMTESEDDHNYGDQREDLPWLDADDPDDYERDLEQIKELISTLKELKDGVLQDAFIQLKFLVNSFMKSNGSIDDFSFLDFLGSNCRFDDMHEEDLEYFVTKVFIPVFQRNYETLQWCSFKELPVKLQREILLRLSADIYSVADLRDSTIEGMTKYEQIPKVFECFLTWCSEDLLKDCLDILMTSVVDVPRALQALLERLEKMNDKSLLYTALTKEYFYVKQGDEKEPLCGYTWCDIMWGKKCQTFDFFIQFPQRIRNKNEEYLKRYRERHQGNNYTIFDTYMFLGNFEKYVKDDKFTHGFIEQWIKDFCAGKITQDKEGNSLSCLFEYAAINYPARLVDLFFKVTTVGEQLILESKVGNACTNEKFLKRIKAYQDICVTLHQAYEQSRSTGVTSECVVKFFNMPLPILPWLADSVFNFFLQQACELFLCQKSFYIPTEKSFFYFLSDNFNQFSEYDQRLIRRWLQEVIESHDVELLFLKQFLIDTSFCKIIKDPWKDMSSWSEKFQQNEFQFETCTNKKKERYFRYKFIQLARDAPKNDLELVNLLRYDDSCIAKYALNLYRSATKETVKELLEHVQVALQDIDIDQGAFNLLQCLYDECFHADDQENCVLLWKKIIKNMKLPKLVLFEKFLKSTGNSSFYGAALYDVQSWIQNRLDTACLMLNVLAKSVQVEFDTEQTVEDLQYILKNCWINFESCDFKASSDEDLDFFISQECMTGLLQHKRKDWIQLIVSNFCEKIASYDEGKKYCKRDVTAFLGILIKDNASCNDEEWGQWLVKRMNDVVQQLKLYHRSRLEIVQIQSLFNALLENSSLLDFIWFKYEGIDNPFINLFDLLQDTYGEPKNITRELSGENFDAYCDIYSSYKLILYQGHDSKPVTFTKGYKSDFQEAVFCKLLNRYRQGQHWGALVLCKAMLKNITDFTLPFIRTIVSKKTLLKDFLKANILKNIDNQKGLQTILNATKQFSSEQKNNFFNRHQDAISAHMADLRYKKYCYDRHGLDYDRATSCVKTEDVSDTVHALTLQGVDYSNRNENLF